MYFMLTVYLNLDNKISAEVPDLCLDLIKLTVEKKKDSYTQIVPSILKSFPIIGQKNQFLNLVFYLIFLKKTK